MSILVYMIFMLIVTTGMLICVLFAHKIGTKVSKKIMIMEMLASAMLCFACVYIFTQKEDVAFVCRMFFYIFSDYLALVLLQYVEVYTEKKVTNKLINIIIIVIILADNISILINCWTHHAFVLTPVDARYGRIFLRVQSVGPYLTAHFLLFYLLLLVSFIVLIRKCCQVSYFYRTKYLGVIVAFAFAWIINLVLFHMNLTLDYSLIAFGIMGISICYYSLYYMPKGLVERTLSLVIKKMNTGIVCFDNSGKCVYVNDLAAYLLQLKVQPSKIQDCLCLWNQRLQDEDSVQWDEEWMLDGKEHHFSLSYQKLFDDKEQVIGHYCEIVDCTVEIENYEREHYKATHDELTGVYNRAYFFQKVSEMLHEHKDETYMMLCSDIRDFKLVNDLFGLERGDEILKKEAEMLEKYASCFRKGIAVYGRLFGDRFALCIQKQWLNKEYLLRKMALLRDLFSSTEFHMHLYAGLYEITDIDEDPAIMCDKAIIAMETLHGDYANSIASYDDTMIKKSMQEKRLVSEFERAIEENEFVLFLQPQANVQGEVHGGEALVRWKHPEMGLLLPNAFIPIFEKTGLIYRLDQYIWEAAVIQLRKWKEKGLGQFYISVNISPTDFYYLDIYHIFTSLIEKYDVDVRNLKLEITETAIMSDIDKNLEIIKELQNYGFIIEMDDFGSGYSSLNTLKDIPANVLKIDMGFLKESSQTARSQFILKSIISLAEILGMDVITEGVETKEQVDMLTEMGCYMFQGYYFSKPIPMEEFEKKYVEKVIS